MCEWAFWGARKAALFLVLAVGNVGVFHFVKIHSANTQVFLCTYVLS